MLRDDLPPRRTGSDRAKWPPHDRTPPHAATGAHSSLGDDFGERVLDDAKSCEHRAWCMRTAVRCSIHRTANDGERCSPRRAMSDIEFVLRRASKFVARSVEGLTANSLADVEGRSRGPRLLAARRAAELGLAGTAGATRRHPVGGARPPAPPPGARRSHPQGVGGRPDGSGGRVHTSQGKNLLPDDHVRATSGDAWRSSLKSPTPVFA